MSKQIPSFNQCREIFMCVQKYGLEPMIAAAQFKFDIKESIAREYIINSLGTYLLGQADVRDCLV